MTQNIGRFEVLRELGRGAQSIVYLCNDPHLQREVAIKTLHFAEADPRLNAYLLAEARTVSKLRHASIVPIFEAGEQDGDPYLVFEYVEGESLAQMLRGKPLPPVRAAELVVDILDALAHAHAQGIIHRDLKPSNIIIDTKGTPRVMDFGIAVRVSEEQGSQEEGLMGTPPYMAPEYVRDRTINEKTDLYAMGLILLEMLSGRRVVQADSLPKMLAKIVGEPVQLPAGLNIDERLGSIILKALAPDPQLRYENVSQMQLALENYLDPDLSESMSEADADKSKSTVAFLMRRMRHKSDFPALSDSVSAINRLTNSDKESINKLSNTILKDYALTVKILRIVNAAFYRQSGGGNISTVSRAVIVLGFDAIRNVALTVLLFEHLQNKGNAHLLKEAFLRANLAGLLARDISLKLLPREAEEAFICSMFHGLGRLLGQYYFPEEMDEMRKLMMQKNCSEDAAVQQALGSSFEDLGVGIARHWGFPPAVVNSMRRIPDGQVKKPATRDETLYVMANFSNELCDSIANTPLEDRRKAMKLIAQRYSSGISISDEQMQQIMEKAVEELNQTAVSLQMNLKQSSFARNVKGWAGGAATLAGDKSATIIPKGLGDIDTDMAQTLLVSGDTFASASRIVNGTNIERGGLVERGEAGNGEEYDAVIDVTNDIQATLAAGIQDISNSLVEEFSLNDVLRITLETMYRAMGFKRVLLCLRDAKTNQMVGRFGFGPDTSEIARHFRFPLGIATDVFRVVASKGVDIIITDINDPKIMERIPTWYRQHIPAETFVLFPLMLKGQPVALIYCDKDKAGEIVIPPKELSLLKTLRNQALLAIKQAA